MLKEQDALIELIREWIIHPESVSSGVHLSVVEVFEIFENMIREHVTSETTRLKKYLPHSAKHVFIPLPLVQALHEYDAKTKLLKRQYIPPTFKEVRHILNIATIHAIATHVKLVTFDADDTIYEDGGSICEDSDMTSIIVGLLERGIIVSLVTAAGYPGAPEKYEKRLRGILDALEKLPREAQSRFFVMGGECNYLHSTRINEDNKLMLNVLNPVEWQLKSILTWSENDIRDLLDKSEVVLKKAIDRLELRANILRKDRAVGIINAGQKRLSYENLEEIALTVQNALKGSPIPHCAFNGGNDVFVDIGNKALGITALQSYVSKLFPSRFGKGEMKDQILEYNCLHVGDRFTSTGNDTRSRDVSMSAWVSNPEETVYVMKKLIADLDDIQK